MEIARTSFRSGSWSESVNGPIMGPGGALISCALTVVIVLVGAPWKSGCLYRTTHQMPVPTRSTGRPAPMTGPGAPLLRVP